LHHKAERLRQARAASAAASAPTEMEGMAEGVAPEAPAAE